MARTDVVLGSSNNTVENQLNTTYQQDLKNEQDAFNYFMS